MGRGGSNSGSMPASGRRLIAALSVLGEEGGGRVWMYVRIYAGCTLSFRGRGREEGGQVCVLECDTASFHAEGPGCGLWMDLDLCPDPAQHPMFSLNTGGPGCGAPFRHISNWI